MEIPCSVLLTLSACSGAQPERAQPPCASSAGVEVDSTKRAQLVGARDAVWRAYYAGDTASLGRLLPERMIGMGESRADIIAASLHFSQGRRLLALEFSCDEFFVSGDVAVVFSSYRVEHEVNGERAEDRGRAIEVFEQRDGRWVNPSWHLDEYD